MARRPQSSQGPSDPPASTAPRAPLRCGHVDVATTLLQGRAAGSVPPKPQPVSPVASKAHPRVLRPGSGSSCSHRPPHKCPWQLMCNNQVCERLNKRACPKEHTLGPRLMPYTALADTAMGVARHVCAVWGRRTGKGSSPAGTLRAGAVWHLQDQGKP